MDKLLLQFKAIVEYKNMTKASEKLYIDRSTLSKNMDSLEKRLNILLLKRTNKGVGITTEGLILYKSICVMNSKYEDTLNEIQALSKNNSILRIGSDLSINYSMLLDNISRIQEDYPHISIHVQQGTALELSKQILNNEIDIFVGSISSKTYNISSLTIENLDTINYDLFINNDSLLLTESHLNKELLNDSNIFNWYSMGNSPVITEFLSKHKLKYNVKFTSSDINMILNVATADHKACVLLPTDLIDKATEYNLGIHKPFNLSLELNVGIIHKNINQKQSLKLFLQKLF